MRRSKFAVPAAAVAVGRGSGDAGRGWRSKRQRIARVRVTRPAQAPPGSYSRPSQETGRRYRAESRT